MLIARAICNADIDTLQPKKRFPKMTKMTNLSLRLTELNIPKIKKFK